VISALFRISARCFGSCRSRPSVSRSAKAVIPALDASQFEVTVRYHYPSGQACAAPRGELDILTANDLERALDAASEGRTTLEVDLAGLEFCDAAGLRVIAHTARRLADRGGGLSLRSPSAMMVKLLDITGLQALVTVAAIPPPQPAPAVPDSEQLEVAIADSLAALTADAHVDATMRTVATLAQHLGVAVDAASVTLRRHGRLVTVATTHPLASDFDQAQYHSEAGPCVEAATTGRVVHGYPDRDTSPWPALRHAAQQAGIHAMLSTPFPDSGHLIGALNLYAGSQDFDQADRDLASLLVAEAASILAVKPLDRQDLSQRLRQALADRDRIVHAQGIMMERHHLTAPQAYTRLRHDAAAAATFLNDTAAHVIDDTMSPAPPPPAEDDT
jgi:anti-anti-sigma factor